ncbi:branched-chain amino acid ABC transporter permease [Nocardioides insulae]|uniref:branched-chain amino acid ABC transporter permease n=1 Tax=Nocardioides insulae TaxID=394734 RepID=UPI000422D364|nr:branched-chain amino acid ABC transporter permease [Nocardioides insulae]
MTSPAPATSASSRLRGGLRGLRQAQPPLDAPVWLKWATFLGVLAVAVLVPLNSAPYVNFDLSMVMIYAVVGMGLNLLIGFNGQISLGHSAFFAIGAYIAAVGIQEGWHYLAVLPVALVVTWVVGYLFGLPALRLGGLALALVTLGLAIVTPAAIKRLDEYTHGQEGINVYTATPPDWSGLERDQWVYFLCLVALALVWVITRRISTGRIGRSLIAVRDNETVARTLGVRSSRTKTAVFALSAAYAGLGGVLYVYVVQFVGPDSFGLVMAIAFISLVVVGGLGTLSGAILGAFFIVYVPEWTADINQAASGMAYGIALILFMFVMPFGLGGLVRALLRPIVERLPGRRGPLSMRTPPQAGPRVGPDESAERDRDQIGI